MKKKILIIDGEDSSGLAQYLSAFNEFSVVGDTRDGLDGLEMAKKLKPDLIVLDLILPRLDGYTLLSEVKKAECSPKVIVISSLCGSAHVSEAMRAGADYFLQKPYNYLSVKERILSLCENHSPQVSQAPLKLAKSLDEKISGVFMTVGIPAHIKGYQYLREAVKLTVRQPEVINSITKKLYPTVAETFATSASKVERSIRHAIEVAWNRGKIENINALFGIKIYSSNEKPTNGEFVALVADKLLIEG